jgi:TPR repeat protein
LGDFVTGDISIKKLVALLLYVLAISGIFAADGQDWQHELADAQAALANGDKALAFKQYKQQAEKGNPLAQFTLGWYLKSGWLDGIVDRKTACDWFQRSTKHNIPVGLQETGHCFRDSIITSENPAQDAIEYYVEAQRNGVFAAACDSLVIEVTSLNMKQPTQVDSCEQAAAQNAVYAQEILIELYTTNAHLKNNQRALYWLEQAAPKSGKSAYRYALTLNSSEQVPKSDVIYWFETSATMGYLPAYLDTAASYYKQITPELPSQQASEYLAKAFLWSKAWLARKEKGHIQPDWITQILQETPKAWHQELEIKVQQHLAKFVS